MYNVCALVICCHVNCSALLNLERPNQTDIFPRNRSYLHVFETVSKFSFLAKQTASSQMPYCLNQFTGVVFYAHARQSR